MAGETVAADILVRFRATDETAGPSAAAAANIDKVGKKADDTSRVMRAALGGALSAVTGLLAQSARAAAEEEAGIERMRVSVQNAGLDFGKLSDAIEAKIKIQQRSTAFGDGEQRDSFSALVAQTKDASEAFKLQAIAMDLARGKGIDLATATTLVGKVANGQTSALTRMGIAVKEGATAQEALAMLQQRYAGQAEAYGATTQGALDRIKNGLGDLQEDLGGMLGGAQTVIALLPGLSTGFTAAGAAAGWFATGANRARIASVLSLAPLRNLVLGIRALNLAMLMSPAGLVAAGLAALAVGLKFAYDRAEPFRRFVNAAWQALSRMVAPLKFVVDGLKAIGQTLGVVGPDVEETSDSLAGLGGAAETSAAKIERAFDRIREAKLEKGGGGSDRIEELLKTFGLDEESIRELLNIADDLTGLTEEQIDKARKERAVAALDSIVFKKLVGEADEVIAETERAIEAAGTAAEKAALRVQLKSQQKERDRLATEAAHWRTTFDAKVKAQSGAQIASRDRARDAYLQLKEEQAAVVELTGMYGGLARSTGRALLGAGTGARDAHDAGVYRGPAPVGGGGASNQFAHGVEDMLFMRPTTIQVAEAGPERVSVRRGSQPSGGGVVINAPITVNLSGAATAADGERIAQIAYDHITEMLRREGRRSGLIASPFGAA